MRGCVVEKRVAVLRFSYDRFQSRYRGDGVHEVEWHYVWSLSGDSVLLGCDAVWMDKYIGLFDVSEERITFIVNCRTKRRNLSYSSPALLLFSNL